MNDPGYNRLFSRPAMIRDLLAGFRPRFPSYRGGLSCSEPGLRWGSQLSASCQRLGLLAAVVAGDVRWGLEANRQPRSRAPGVSALGFAPAPTEPRVCLRRSRLVAERGEEVAGIEADGFGPLRGAWLRPRGTR